MTKQSCPSRDADKFIVRMPDGLRSRIAARSARNGRSMNAEVVIALEEAFPNQAELDGFAADLETLGRVFTANIARLPRERIRCAVSELLAEC